VCACLCAVQVGVPSTDEELDRLFAAMDHAGTGE
jgi:hypothetical protein